MQSFLQSTDSPAAIIDKFEGDSSQDPTDLRLVSTCFEVRSHKALQRVCIGLKSS